MFELKLRLVRLVSGAGLIFILLLFFGIQSAFATSSPDSFAYDPQPTPTPGSLSDLCEDHGGVWIGYGHYKESCIYVPPYRPYGKSGASSTGPHSQEDAHHSTTLHLSGEKNGYAVFPYLACPQQCTITATLPHGASNDLPQDALAMMYVRLVNFGGAPGTSAYWVCFENKNLKDPAIYRYLQGEWVRLTFVRNSNPFCTFVSLEGSYYLGDG
ncbi:MAG TPA: hypothetical protein VLK33_20670 [Terriglobales bacterium]|nr:hypothetical protein [Terriglobales bacterium]